MMFRQEDNQLALVRQEHEVLDFWASRRCFEKLVELRSGGPPWHFLDGPITANNPMGMHHAWGRTFKDVWQRFNAMRGCDERWQNGFDSQGLWVEVNVEKELGFNSKRDIETYGIAEFIRKCKQRVLRYGSLMTRQSQRLGMWMKWDDPELLLELERKLGEDSQQIITVDGPQGPVTATVEQIVGQLGTPQLGGSYFTLSDENNYTIWLFLKRCWEKGWLYKGRDVMPWCVRCETGISQHEIVTDGYRELVHRSVYVRFPIRGREKEALLVWTTTPWTLTTDVAAAVHPELTYVKLRQDDWVYYLAKNTVASAIKGPYTIERELPGKELVGLTYSGPFDELSAVRDMAIPDAHVVVEWNEVSEDEGTGIVHISPGSGAEDFVLGKKLGLPVLAPLRPDGTYVEGFDWLSGRSASHVADDIFADLEKKDLLYRILDYTHRYPVCWRCGEELLFRLIDEWFIHMGEVYDKPRNELTAEETARSLRYQIMEVAEKVQWIPEFGQQQELDWLRNMHDWMISKKRYWGLALPIWVCDACDAFEVLGGPEELEQRAVAGWEDAASHSPHRPYIDQVKIECGKCGSRMSRIPDVGNPWLDAGIVAFSTLRYRTDREYFEKWFPGDFITESFPGQFRNWFYAVLAMSTVLERRVPFRAVLGYGQLLGEDGRPMHKSWGNAIDFDEGIEKIGADVSRWMFCAHPPEKNLLFGYGLANEVRRRFFIPLWNVYYFLVTYARLDRWTPEPAWDPAAENDLPPIDRWLLGRLQETIMAATEHFESFEPARLTQELETYLDDLSNWYLRRNRRRFWKSEADRDKTLAYSTLYHCLESLIRMLAPLIPFLTETIYQNLVRAVDENAPESVHHCLFPEVNAALLSAELTAKMARVRQAASLAHAARNAAGIKIRQPLSELRIHGPSLDLEDGTSLTDILAAELNVKRATFAREAGELIEYEMVPDAEHWGPLLKQDFPRFKKALAETDGGTAARLKAGGQIDVALGQDQTVSISSENVIVRARSRPGLAVMEDRDFVVGLVTEITPELAQEGIARDVVRHIQNLRKEAELEMSDRIEIAFAGDAPTRDAIAGFSDYIATETLAEGLREAEPAGEGFIVSSVSVGGSDLRIAIRRV